MEIKYECNDFLMFQESLKRMRQVDDNIINALNKTIPTESFKKDASDTCRVLFNDLKIAHDQREGVIKKCILLTANNVKELKTKRDDNQDDISLNKHFKSEQRKLNMLQSELNVEDIIKERTYKTFNERCRLFFTQPL